MIRRALAVVGRRVSTRLFAVAVNRVAASPRDPVEIAFEELCDRLNLFLQRINNRQTDTQRGLLVMDNMKHEKPLQAPAIFVLMVGDGATFGKLLKFLCLSIRRLRGSSRSLT
jgi:hypothetical protein